MKNIRRFTLVELLAVVGLIAILSAIGFGSYSYAMGKARESSSQALIKQLEAGLESFHAKNGYYPPSGGNFSPVKLELNNDGTVKELDFGGTGGKFTYSTETNRKARLENERFESLTKAMDMEVLKKHLGANGEVEDSWGGMIYYCAPGKFNKAGFDLVSAGPDGKFGSGNADNPTGITDLTLFHKDGEALCDDLYTF